jgi:hypothetical protein
MKRAEFILWIFCVVVMGILFIAQCQGVGYV